MIKLSQGTAYKVIPEGRNIFKIKNAIYKTNEAKVEVTMTTEDGLSHIERFYFNHKDGTFNQGGLDAFSAFARAATGSTSIDQVEVEDLVGRYVSANVSHTKMPNRNDPTRTVTFVNLKSYAPARPTNRVAKTEIEF